MSCQKKTEARTSARACGPRRRSLPNKRAKNVSGLELAQEQSAIPEHCPGHDSAPLTNEGARRGATAIRLSTIARAVVSGGLESESQADPSPVPRRGADTENSTEKTEIRELHPCPSGACFGGGPAVD